MSATRSAVVALLCAAATAAPCAVAGAVPPVTLSQVTTLGAQETVLAGVPLTSGGVAVFGRLRALRAALGPGWRCEPVDSYDRFSRWWTWRAAPRAAREAGAPTRGIDIRTGGILTDPPCASDMAVLNVQVGRRGATIRTQAGRFTVGRRWATVPRAVRRLVTWSGATETGRVHFLGHRQDPCRPGRRLPGIEGRGLLEVGLDGGGRVRLASVANAIGEGTSCDP